jgi:cyclophilin family peptidyl-prolyl cis-trans isomerase
LSMARSQDQDSAGSQFFVALKDSKLLEEWVFGRATSGMMQRVRWHPWELIIMMHLLTSNERSNVLILTILFCLLFHLRYYTRILFIPLSL